MGRVCWNSVERSVSVRTGYSTLTQEKYLNLQDGIFMTVFCWEQKGINGNIQFSEISIAVCQQVAMLIQKSKALCFKIFFFSGMYYVL